MIDPKNRALANPPDIFYDAAGHTTRLASQDIDMEWDALGMQLVFKRQLPSFQQQVYIYGPGNLPILSFDSQDGALTWNQRDFNGKVLRTWRHTGSLDVSSPLSVYRHEKDYLYGLEGMFASRTAAGEERYFHSDHLGSPRAISNSLGQSVGQHHYYPFDHKAVPNAPCDDRFCKFTGHERDPNGGTDYILGRTYAESFQRFLSVDPGRDGWNLYAYVGNNPMNAVDPNRLKVARIKDKRSRVAAAKFQQTKAGRNAFKILEGASGTYVFERRRSRLTPVEKLRLGRGEEVKKQGGHLKPAFAIKNNKVEFVSGGTIILDFDTVDSAKSGVYAGENGDAAIFAHETGHGVDYETADSREDFLNLPYSTQEEMADELRDEVVRELEEKQ